MAQNKIVGYKNIFGFTLPDWVDEGTIRMVVTFLLSSTAMLFVLIFVIWPKFSDITKMKVTLKSGQEELQSLKNSKLGYDQLNEDIPESTQNIILSAIPQTYSPETAIFLLRKLSSETPGMSMVSYKLPSGVLYEVPGGAATTKSKVEDSEIVGFISFPIKLTVTAPVASLLEFINKIETSLPLGVVSDMGMQEVSKLVKSTPTKSVQMDLEVKFYQAILKKVDIAKIKPVTTDDLKLVNELTLFTQTGIQSNTGSNISPVATSSSGSLFGF